MSLLHRLRKGARRFGLEVRRFRSDETPPARLVAALRRHAADGVIDVGAHEGGFVQSLREAGWHGPALSIEPLPEVHRRLVARARHDRAWTVAPCCALGEADDTALLHVAGQAASSSLLPMLPAHWQAAPGTAIVDTQAVMVMRLDDLAVPALAAMHRPFLKIDVQGAEMAVLRGAPETLSRCVGLQVELTLEPLYAGQALWREVIDLLAARGFVTWDLQPIFSDPASGRLLQMDGVFFREAPR
jgi:FkbM family methyltransferase